MTPKKTIQTLAEQHSTGCNELTKTQNYDVQDRFDTHADKTSEKAGHKMRGASLPAIRESPRASCLCAGAARMKDAAVGRFGGAGHVARQENPPPVQLDIRIRQWHSREQRLGIRMERGVM